MLRSLITVLLLLALTAGAQPKFVTETREYIPRAADSYKRNFIRIHRHYFGMDAPIALLAAQIHQESAWNQRAKSKYASCLSQLTPETEQWLKTNFSKYLAGEGGIMNPVFCIKAQGLYTRWLGTKIVANDECHKWSFILASYNGGHGWTLRDKNLAEQKGLDRNARWDHVELHSDRADWAFEENRGYPRKIIGELQLLYKDWGRNLPLVCGTG